MENKISTATKCLNLLKCTGNIVFQFTKCTGNIIRLLGMISLTYIPGAK